MEAEGTAVITVVRIVVPLVALGVEMYAGVVVKVSREEAAKEMVEAGVVAPDDCLNEMTSVIRPHTYFLT